MSAGGSQPQSTGGGQGRADSTAARPRGGASEPQATGGGRARADPTAARPGVAVVVVLHDSAADVDPLCASLARHLPGARLVAVDSGSTDDGAARAAALGAEVVALEGNPGFGAANNAGMARVDEDVTVLLNPDCEVPDAGLASLVAPASRRDLIDIVGEVAEEMLVAVIGIDAVDASGEKVALEMLLLPFRSRAHTPLSLTGLLVPLTPVRAPIRALSLAAWRYDGHRRDIVAPRALRKLAMARGLVVYEGLR